MKMFTRPALIAAGLALTLALPTHAETRWIGSWASAQMPRAQCTQSAYFGLWVISIALVIPAEQLGLDVAGRRGGLS